MKLRFIKVQTFFTVLLLLCAVASFGQGPPPPPPGPPGGLPPPPGEALPIDDGKEYVITVAVLVGLYLVYRQQRSVADDVLKK